MLRQLIIFIGTVVSMVHGFYYQQQQFQQPLVAPMLYAESHIYPNLEQFQAPPQPEVQQPDETVWQETSSSMQMPFRLPFIPRPAEAQDVCQTGFVEHCLIQANQDGQQSLMEAAGNRTNESEQQLLAREFDGMCHVVIRFIDCLNHHYARCSPVQNGEGAHQLKDMFHQSWSGLCAADGRVRRKYLEHASCIKTALSQNNGQEQCQARFQGYFMSGQFSLDSVENAIQFGCCAFNEWQYCIDSLIVRECGHEAMKSVQDLIEQASGGLVSSLCDKKVFGRKTKVCSGKKTVSISKLNTLDPKMNATLHKYISIFGDFIDRLPDEEEGEAAAAAASN